MLDGKVKIRKAYDNMVVVIVIEEEILLHLDGTSAHAHNFAYLYQQNEGTLPSTLLWHVIFGHVNYDNIRLLKNNDVFGLPIIPRKLKQCGACGLGKHRKQPFYDYTSITHKRLTLIHPDLWGPTHVPSENGNRYMMTCIDDYIGMCWVC